MKTPIPFEAILLVQAATTWFLVGLIWMVQVVHYPLFSDVGKQHYEVYQQKHQERITWIVGPTMVLELLLAMALISFRPEQGDVNLILAWVGLALVVSVWLTTAFVSVPCHSRLSVGFDESAHQWLVGSNWLRTFGWTAKGLIALWMVRDWYLTN